MAEHSAGFKVYADSTAFQKGMVDARRAAEEAGKGISKAFEMKDIGRTLATALGLNLEKIAEKLVEPMKESAEAAERIAKYSEEAAAATERLLNSRKSDLQQLKEMEQKLEKMQRTPARAEDAGFFEKLLTSRLLDPLGLLNSYFDKSAERQAEADAKRARDITVLNEQIASKKAELEKKNNSEAMKAEVERTAEIEKQAQALKELAEFEREQRREKMSAEARIADLRKEEAQITKDIAAFEKFRKEDGVLTADGARELIDLKKTQAELQKRIADESERAASAEVRTVETLAKQEKALAAIAGIRTSRQFGDASDEALQESIRRNRNAITGMGGILNIGQQMEVARLQAEIQNLQRELDFRTDLRRNVQLGGVEFARGQFQGDPLSFDRLVQQLVEDNRDLRDVLVDTNTRLQQLTDGKRSLPVVVLNQQPPRG